MIGIGTEVKENERESSVPWVVCAWVSRTIFFHGELSQVAFIGETAAEESAT